MGQAPRIRLWLKTAWRAVPSLDRLLGFGGPESGCSGLVGRSTGARGRPGLLAWSRS